MTPAYMPFTYLSEATARMLTSLVGPVVVYQPLQATLPAGLSDLASRKLIEIRTPMTQDDDRLRAALAEFTAWAHMNPGKSTPGPDFIGSRQGEIPFFEETAVNRIRADIKRYHAPQSQTVQQEAQFSARLFLAVAQENDAATDCLDNDLACYQTLEKGFLKSLADADDAGFSRQGLGGEIWREDPGIRLTEQRIRAWATLAMGDANQPEMLITTSSAVIDSLLEAGGGALNLEKRISLRLAVPPAGSPPLLAPLLTDLAARDTVSTADLGGFTAPAADAAAEPAFTATCFVIANQPPASFIRHLAPATAGPAEEKTSPGSPRHTLVVLIQS